MKHLSKICISLLTVSAILLLSIPLIAQEYSKGLIFSEVFLDANNRTNSWIEIYNPTDTPLVLSGFRLSNIRTPNMLMIDEKKGGYKIKSGECLILCNNRKKFEDEWGKQKNLIMVKGISMFNNGGYIELSTKDMRDSGIDAFRYGDPEISAKNASFCNTHVIEISNDGKSWSRILKGSESGFRNNGFEKTAPSPGKRDK